MHSSKVLYQLAGLLAFIGILAIAHYLGEWGGVLVRDTYNLTQAFVLYIPAQFLLVLGTLLLRLDILWQAILTRGVRIRVSTLVVYAWPFIIFVITLPLLLWISPNEPASKLLMTQYQWFGRSSGQIASIVFGIGIIAALESRDDA